MHSPIVQVKVKFARNRANSTFVVYSFSFFSLCFFNAVCANKPYDSVVDLVVFVHKMQRSLLLPCFSSWPLKTITFSQQIQKRMNTQISNIFFPLACALRVNSYSISSISTPSIIFLTGVTGYRPYIKERVRE